MDIKKLNDLVDNNLSYDEQILKKCTIIATYENMKKQNDEIVLLFNLKDKMIDIDDKIAAILSNIYSYGNIKEEDLINLGISNKTLKTIKILNHKEAQLSDYIDYIVNSKNINAIKIMIVKIEMLIFEMQLRNKQDKIKQYNKCLNKLKYVYINKEFVA